MASAESWTTDDSHERDFEEARLKFKSLTAQKIPGQTDKNASQFDASRNASEEVAQASQGTTPVPGADKPTLKACASAAFKKGDYETACDFFQQAIQEQEPNPSVLYSNLSAARLAMGQARAALEAADECIELEPGWFKGFYRRGEALAALKEYARALAAFSTAMEMGAGDQLLVTKMSEIQKKLRTEQSKGIADVGGVSGMQPAWGKVSVLPPSGGASDASTGAGPNSGANTHNELQGPRPSAGLDVQTPPLFRMGGSAFDKIRKRKDAKKLQSAPEREPAAAAEPEKTLPPAEATHKRCKLCGNVVHIRMMTCTSCCFPLVEPEAYDVAQLPSKQEASDHKVEPKPAASASNSTTEYSRRFGGKQRLVTDAAGVQPLPGSDEAVVYGPHLPTAGCTEGGNERSLDRLEEYRQYMRELWERKKCYSRGFDPALQQHFDVLGLPLGSGEAETRAAYRELIVQVHPDSGGDPEDLLKVQLAYDVISEDALAHEAGVAALIGQDADQQTLAQSDGPTIFVSVASYRDAEVLHTLRDMYEKASKPSRVFTGVVYQYVNALPEDDEFGKVVTRFFSRVNLVTQAAEQEAAKYKDEDSQYKFLKRVRKTQLKIQEEEFQEELRCNTKTSLPEAFQSQIREMHVPFRSAEGAVYARHLAQRLYAGEEYMLQIDSHTRFVEGWDDILLAMLSGCPSQRPVLTGYPLAYALEEQPVLDQKGALIGKLGQPGTAIVPNADDSRDCGTPVVCALKFGPTRICHMCARMLAHTPAAPVPTLFWAGMFSFSRAEALICDAPADAHLPYLNLGDELHTGCRLWTHGWDFYAPNQNVMFHLYKNNYRSHYEREDRRMGKQLYADEVESYGSLDEFNQHASLKTTSQRRVLALMGGPHPETCVASNCLEYGRYGLGDVRTAKQFSEFCGLDFVNCTIAAKATLGGQQPDSFSLSTSAFLPSRWRNGSHILAGAGAQE